MAIHNLFFGGAPTHRNHGYAMFPQYEVGPDDTMHPDNRGAPCLFSLNRRLIWEDCCSRCGCGVGSGCACGSGSRLDGGSSALKHYLEENPVAVGDVINAVILPKETMLQYVWWKVEKAITPFTFDIVVRGNAASLGGTTAVPVPVVIAAGLSGSVLDSGMIDVTALNGGPLWLDQNDMLQVIIRSLPPLVDTSDCSPCSSGGIAGSSIIVSPVLLDPCRYRN